LKKQADILIKLLSITLFISSCSVENNTFTSRAYHNLTSRYNILFNGNESFQAGIYKIERNFQYDFNEILPVFLYGDHDVSSQAFTDMERAVEKGSRLISLHSITARPEIRNPASMSERQREFYNRREYNRYVDDAYLLIGKAHFYKFEYETAASVFRLLANDFRGNIEAYEAELWLARIYNETEQYQYAAEIYESLDNTPDLPGSLRRELYVSMADMYLKQTNYDRAILALEKALELGSPKNDRIRYNFILAQIYELKGDTQQAYDKYSEVISMNPVYDISFHARINRALAYSEGEAGAYEIVDELNKMLRDDKNIEYLDQIYYALGELHAAEGDKEEALHYYMLSVKNNFGDLKQKMRAYKTIADFYYEIPDYLLAQAYYDSTLTLASPADRIYSEISGKSESLSMLVSYIHTVERGDSLLLLSQLSSNELNERIDRIIEMENIKRQEEQQQVSEEILDRQFAEEIRAQALQRQNNTSESGSWYFYNETAKAQGYSDFRLEWGNRRLEDHWQRSNKESFNSLQEIDNNATGIVNINSTTDRQNQNPLSRNYYLENIPLTDSAANSINREIEEALYNMGVTYKNQLSDYSRATEAFRELISRYPSTDYLVLAYYNLYTMSNEQNNPAMAELYRNNIIREFPNSIHAQVLGNPEYLKELELSREMAGQYYEETYLLFQNDEMEAVIERSDYAIENFSADEFAPYFNYLKTLAEGRISSPEVFREKLLEFANNYKGTEQADAALNTITILDRGSKDLGLFATGNIVDNLYIYNPDQEHMYGWIIDPSLNTNQLIFNVINFNLDYFSEKNLRIEVVNLNNNQSIILVKVFPNKEEVMEYYLQITENIEILNDVPDTDLIPLVISTDNYAKLLEERSSVSYLMFFNENYF